LDANGGQAGGGDAGREEAAWRDLIARYDMAVDTETAAPPWPEIENLGTRQLGQAIRDQAQHEQAQHDQAQHDQPPRDTGTGTSNPASLGGVAYTASQPAGVQPGADADPTGSGTGPHEAETGPHEPVTRPLGQETRPRDPEAGSSPGSSDGPASDSTGGSAAGSAADRTRVIRHATTPAPRSPAEEEDRDEDEHYVPPPPPPLPHLDPVAKGAWTALFGGPAYLLVASVAGWVVPGWAALGSVAAFIGGFTVVVLRLSDGPADDEGPDNGAVL
jgi:hypothetical protein